MAYTYEDFLKKVEAEHLSFVGKLHDIFMQNGCKIEVKEAKQGYAA